MLETQIIPNGSVGLNPQSTARLMFSGSSRLTIIIFRQVLLSSDEQLKIIHNAI
ncbi:hypothetical protein GCM10022397_32530 [Flavivirga jejuensis]